MKYFDKAFLQFWFNNIDIHYMLDIEACSSENFKQLVNKSILYEVAALYYRPSRLFSVCIVMHQLKMPESR